MTCSFPVTLGASLLDATADTVGAGGPSQP